MFDKDKEYEKIKGFFNRKEEKQNATDIVKVLVDLSGESIWSEF